MSEALFVGLTLTIATLLAFLWYAVVVRAIWRCIPKNSSFIVLLSQSVADMGVLIHSFWLGAEIAFGYSFFPSLNARVHSFIYNCSMLSVQTHYILVAINRCSATVMISQYSAAWTHRRCLFAVFVTWFLSILMNVGIHLVDPSEDVYFTHVPAEYALMPKNYTLFMQSILFPIWESLDYGELVVPLSIYTFTVGFSLFRKTSLEQVHDGDGRHVSLQIELRLTILCIINFAPYAAMIFGTLMFPFNGKMGQFARNLLVVGTSSVNGILLPCFSSLVREHIFRKHLKANVSNIARIG